MMSGRSSRRAIQAALIVAVGVSTLAHAQQVPAPKTAEQVKGTPTGTVMTKEYVATVGRFVYLWGWPLVNNANRALAIAKLPEPGRMGGIVPVAPPGYISMLTDYIDAAERSSRAPTRTPSTAPGSSGWTAPP